MKPRAVLLVVAILAAPGLADGPAGPKATMPPPSPLGKKDREGLAHLLKKVAPTAKPKLAYAAMTPAEARRIADIPAWLDWQIEYDGWFVFGKHDRAGGPDVWSGVYFVRKGTNVVGFFRETW